MSRFASPAEFDCYVGGLLRLAAVDPYIGPRLADARLTLRLVCPDIPASIAIDMYDPITVVWNDDQVAADVELIFDADLLDAYLRGHQSLIDALSQGTVLARGRVSRVLKVLPVLELAFPFYRHLVAAKDAARAARLGVPS